MPKLQKRQTAPPYCNSKSALPEQRLAVSIEGDRIVAADGKPGVPVDHDPFRDAAGSRPKRQTGKKADDDRENRDPRAPFLPLLPCCGHSFGEPSADSQRPKKRYKPRLRGQDLAGACEQGVNWGRSMNPAARFGVVALILAGLGMLTSMPGSLPVLAQNSVLAQNPEPPPAPTGPVAPPPPQPPASNQFSANEVIDAGHHFFGGVSRGLAALVEKAGNQWGQPNGYILGEEAGGAFIGGLRYGDGTLYTKNAGDVRVYWQGPSLGFDAGADGARTMMLVYNLPRTEAIFERFGGIAGSAYFVGGLGMTALTANDIVVVPIRSGVGLRLGANLGYLKFTTRPTWNPF